MFFGYMNSNWEEELDVPIGPDNHIDPGGPDQEQPTHFYPRRNMFHTRRSNRTISSTSRPSAPKSART
jgi:hypothetical protein